MLYMFFLRFNSHYCFFRLDIFSLCLSSTKTQMKYCGGPRWAGIGLKRTCTTTFVILLPISPCDFMVINFFLQYVIPK